MSFERAVQFNSMNDSGRLSVGAYRKYLAEDRLTTNNPLHTIQHPILTWPETVDTIDGNDEEGVDNDIDPCGNEPIVIFPYQGHAQCIDLFY